MVAVTPEEWLPILSKRLDDRAARIARLRSYVNGQAPLPEMGKNTRAAWVAFQQKARTNIGGLAVESLVNRIRPQSVRVGSDEDSEATQAARKIWRDNQMVVQIGAAVWDAEACGVGYLVTGLDDGGALVTAESPELFIASPDPARPWRARAALKAWRDEDEEKDYALVWANGLREQFSRPPTVNGVCWRRTFGEWVSEGAQPYTGHPPVKILSRHDGLALLEPHLDVIDRINLGKLQRLVITAKQAYKQRALKGGPLPESDENGNQIDYSKVFEADPGALWDLPEGIDIWESADVDIRPLLDGEKQDARDFAAVTKTPVSVLMPDGQNQSAEGALNAKEQQIMAAQDEIDRFSPAIAACMVDALRAEGVDLAGQTVEIAWQQPALTSMSERYAAAAQAKAAGESWKSIARNILGYTPDQIAQDERDRRQEGAQSLIAKLPAAAVPAA